jgi:Cu(I)/Ag(I) efflux system periplasmic protein CusF
MKTLRTALSVAMLLAAVSQPVFAQAPAEMTSGQVTKVDASAGKITIKHGAIKKFDMDDGMTMVFRAQDPEMLKAVKAGDKIKFEADKVDGQFTVMKLEKAK